MSCLHEKIYRVSHGIDGERVSFWCCSGCDITWLDLDQPSDTDAKLAAAMAQLANMKRLNATHRKLLRLELERNNKLRASLARYCRATADAVAHLHLYGHISAARRLEAARGGES